MNEREFRIGDRNFKLNKVDALRQFHIVRRIAPLLREMIPAMASMSKTKVDSMSEEEKFGQFAELAAPIIDGLAKLSDADADFVLFRLLASVEVEQSQYKSWTFIATETGIKMQDLELPVLLQVAGRALMFNLSGFFDSLHRVA